MDMRRFSVRTHKIFIRLNAVIGSLAPALMMVNFGMGNIWQVVIMTGLKFVADIFGTVNDVSGTKLFADVSPYADERAKLQLSKQLGEQYLGYLVSNMANLLMGFQDTLHLTTYQILLTGSLILLPFAMGSKALPSFMRQRVRHEESEEEREGEKLTFLQSLAVVKHNKYFLLNSAASFLTVFTPAVDQDLIFKYLMPAMTIPFPRIKLGAKTIGGPTKMNGLALLVLKDNLKGLPITFLNPFAIWFINRVGGPRNMHLINSGVTVGMGVLRYFIGYKNIWALLFLMLTEMFINVSGPYDGIAGGIISYEMYDYVEYKTGMRSEGVTTAVNALFLKIVTNNIGTVTGNWFTAWTGYKGDTGEEPTAHFKKWMWLLFTLAPVVDGTIWFFARLLLKYSPNDRVMVEAELVARQKLKEEAKAAIAGGSE
jgi:Na+/melibiose symporter-like transporter